MKFIKITVLAFLLIPFAACLKSKNDFAGMRTDSGEVVTAMLEQQYLTGDASNLGFGYSIYSTFPFAGATENVRFFTLHISQPKAKLSGDLKVKISMAPAAGATAPPAGAITLPAEITVPAQGGVAFDFPVRLAVNKALLDPAETYGVTFTITSVSQGVYSELEKFVDVFFFDAQFYARYKNTTTVTDANNLYGVDNNVKTDVILEDLAADQFDIFDFYLGSHAIIVANKTTGAATGLFNPVYKINTSTGKLIDVINRSTGLSLTPTIDPSSGWIYNGNDGRTFTAKYTVTLTVNAVARAFTVNDKYEWLTPQAF